MIQVIKRRILRLFRNIILIAFVFLAYNSYESISLYLKEKSPTELSCKDYFTTAVDAKWLKLRDCTIISKGILVKDLLKQIYIPIGPKEKEYEDKPLPRKLWVKISDRKIYREFNSLKAKDTAKTLEFLFKIGLTHFTGVLKGEEKVDVNPSPGEKVKLNRKGKVTEVGDVLQWNEKPYFPVKELSILFTIILITFIRYQMKKKLAQKINEELCKKE